MHVYKLFWELNSALLQKAFHRVVGGRLGVTYFFSTSRWCMEGALGCREEYWRRTREATRLSAAGWTARGVGVFGLDMGGGWRSEVEWRGALTGSFRRMGRPETREPVAPRLTAIWQRRGS